MIGFRKQKTARRREVRRTIGRASAPRPAALVGRDLAMAALYVLILSCVGSLIVVCARRQLPVAVGQPITEPIVARVRFQSINKALTESKKQSAREQEPEVYNPNQAYFDTIAEKLNGLIALAADEKSIEQISEDQVQSLQLDEASLEQLRGYVADGKPNPRWNELVRQFIEDLGSLVVLSEEDAQREAESKPSKIIIEHPIRGEMERVEHTIISVSDQPETLKNNVVSLAGKFPAGIRHTVVTLVMKNIDATYRYDPQKSERRREMAAHAQPDEIRTFEPNDVLIRVGVDENHRPHEFDLEDLEILKNEQQAYHVQLGSWKRLGTRVAQFGVVCAMAIGLWIYFAAYYRKITHNPMRGLAVTAVLLLCQAAALGLVSAFPQMVYAAALFPTLMVAIVLAIAYDQRCALTVGSMHTLLVTFTLNLPLSFALVLLVGVATAVGQLQDVRHRSKLVQVGLWSGLTMAIMVTITGFFSRPLLVPGEPARIVHDAMRAMATGFATGLFTQGMLPAIESIFKVTTSMTLKDLNDASHLLLRRLAEQAPGTYQHSLAIADMAEGAAEAIGLSGLLCRVGAMYHDIGKSNKPMYFVENQGGGPNRHDKLSPAMSVLIIVGHVKDGIEMAREYRLPEVIRHFIESHHGTTLVEYFYHAAKQQGEGDPDRPMPSEFEFRYPGPKPQTKEAAIIMICDSIESAARTLADPTHARLEQLVHRLAMKRLMDGQFDDSNLTLAEMHKIEDSVTKTLCAIYHSRISYPTNRKYEEAPVETSITAPAPLAS